MESSLTFQPPTVHLGFGVHRGTPITRVPVSYLWWMVNKQTQQWEDAEAELERRGSIRPECEVSGHAVDRASQKLLGVWAATRMDDEGIYSWLCRNFLDAIESGTQVEPGKYHYNGICYVRGEEETVFPTLKTVYPAKRRKPQ